MAKKYLNIVETTQITEKSEKLIEQFIGQHFTGAAKPEDMSQLIDLAAELSYFAVHMSHKVLKISKKDARRKIIDLIDARMTANYATEKPKGASNGTTQPTAP